MTNDRKPLGSSGRPAPIITYSRLQPAPRRQQVVDPRRVDPHEPPASDPAAEQAWDDVDAIPEIRATRHDERPPIPDVDLFVAEPRSRIGRTVAIVAALIILVGLGAFALTSRFGGVAPVPGPTLEAVAPPAADVPDTGDATDAATAADAAAATDATATTDGARHARRRCVLSARSRSMARPPLLPAAAPAAAAPEKPPVPRKKPEQAAVAAPDANAPDAKAPDAKAGVITDGTMRPSTPATASAPPPLQRPLRAGGKGRRRAGRRRGFPRQDRTDAFGEPGCSGGQRASQPNAGGRRGGSPRGGRDCGSRRQRVAEAARIAPGGGRRRLANG